jgi:hypothetical protein
MRLGRLTRHALSPPSRGQDWFHMLDEDGSEIIGIHVRCVAEHTMPVSKSARAWRGHETRGPNADAPVTTAALWVPRVRRGWHDVPRQVGHQVHPESHT